MSKNPVRFLRLLVVAAAFAMPIAAQATPVTYSLDHGSVTAKVWLNGSVVAHGGGSLDVGYVVFDPATGLIPDFSLHSSNVLAWAPILPGAYNALSLDILLQPASGYSSSATGSNPWSVMLGPLSVAFSGYAFDSTAPVTVSPIPVSGVIPINSFGVTAYLTQSEMRLGLIGVKVGEMRIGDQVFDVRADIEFVGFAVPEPSAAGLLALALGIIAWSTRR
jgi:hypothetical protein